MARFRGTVQGGRGPATRLGHNALHVEAQSWQGRVIVTLHTRDDVDYACVQLGVHGNGGCNRILYAGPVSGARNHIDIVADEYKETA